MPRYNDTAYIGKQLFVGIDMHRHNWHVTIITEDNLTVYSARIEGTFDALLQVLTRYEKSASIRCVYEAGYSGFWLYDLLEAHGYETIVCAPNLIPVTDSRVKTDKRDSFKMASCLASDMLTGIHVPDPELRVHRQIARRRRQLMRDRIRTQSRIKAEMRFFGLCLSDEPIGRWSQTFVDNLWRLNWQDALQQESFRALLELYHFLDTQITTQTKRLKALTEHVRYAEQVTLLTSIPGIGWLSAIEICLELGDITRFDRSEQLSAYVGLTPSQYSTGEHVRYGHITRAGKPQIRALLIQCAWVAIRKDEALTDKYRRIAARRGSKRAIVAMARTLLVRARRILIDRTSYQYNRITG